ncbi:MAG: serine/threonine-protein kinase [Calothrix sp. MO_167.B42]|nr:serine/threonine-protein kinase [Calothrix sp. MO_167.B42]
MAEEPTNPLDKKQTSTANQLSKKLTKSTKFAATVLSQPSKRMGFISHLLAATVVGIGVLAVGYNLGLVKLMESQAQTLFFLLRGSVVPPEDIVILAIDEPSLSISEQYYQSNPQKFAYLEPIKKWPYQRKAYAQVIEKLMKAGARSVGLNVVLGTQSSYGADDDRQLQTILQRYGNKITLAAIYQEFERDRQISITQLILPHEKFRTAGISIGSANFPVSEDGKVHKFAGEFPNILEESGKINSTDKIPSFEQAILQGSGVNYSFIRGNRIYFYGGDGTFKRISFAEVLDPEHWNNYLQKGKNFQDKIVLIGPTEKSLGDYHSVAVADNWFQPGKMAGVEIHANAIATLMSGKTLNESINYAPLRGLFVLVLLGGCIFFISRNKQGINRFFVSIGLGIVWGIINYGLFIYGQLILPVAVPIIALSSIGIIYLGAEVFREIVRKRQLIDILSKNSDNRLAQEIISQQDDLKDLLQQREIEIYGKILAGRYKITKVLGAGGFSETYIAQDTQLPDNPLCVVKQLKPVHTKPEQLEVARRLFKSEAQTLKKLGVHDQIPQLFAYFEEDEEFYLIQEYIAGHAFNKELPSGKCLPEIAVIRILHDLLQTLTFVHENGVIHRDIKPNNIIRRQFDGKLVLIDFGAVKEVSTQLLDGSEQSAFTIGIGTKGYAPSEQCFGRPQYGSDIYAVGMIGIKALTGVAPHELLRDADGNLVWMHKTQVSPNLAAILNKMVLDDVKQRYQSTSAVLAALDELISSENGQCLTTDKLSINSFSREPDSDTSTTPWIGELEDDLDSSSSTSIFPEKDDKSN